MELPNDTSFRPLSRHINASLPEILEVLRGRLSSSDIEKFKSFSHLVEATVQFQFLDLRRSIKWSFHLFSRGALGKEYIGRLGRPPPTRPDYIIREKQFLSDFITLLKTAHYEIVTKELWEIALEEEFQLTMPLTVNMKTMDQKMLTRFWAERPDEKDKLPDISDRILIFYRGVSLSKKQDLFISEKINLLITYLLADPVKRLLEKKDKAAENDTSKGEIKEEMIKRITLKQLLPGWKVVVQNFIAKMETVEPTFDDVVVLYRKAKGTLSCSTSPTKDNFTQAKNNIVIKTFHSVPLADLEVIFPEKDVSLSHLSKIVLWVTLIVALFTTVMTLWQTDIDQAVIISVLSLLLGKLFQSYSTMQKEKSDMMTTISKMLYDKTKDSQDGAVFSLLDDMADQKTKDLATAYTLLFLNRGQESSIDTLNESCQSFYLENFGVPVDFCLKEKLKSLLQSGIIKKSENDDNTLVALTLDEATELLTQRWNGAYRNIGNLDENSSFLGTSLGAVSSPLSIGRLNAVSKTATQAFGRTISSTFKGASSLAGSMLQMRPTKKQKDSK